MYLLVNPSVQRSIKTLDQYSEKKKIENIDIYSSDNVPQIPKDELKEIILNSGLLSN